jgi:hypothetical protein
MVAFASVILVPAKCLANLLYDLSMFILYIKAFAIIHVLSGSFLWCLSKMFHHGPILSFILVLCHVFSECNGVSVSCNQLGEVNILLHLFGT